MIFGKFFRNLFGRAEWPLPTDPNFHTLEDVQRRVANLTGSTSASGKALSCINLIIGQLLGCQRMVYQGNEAAPSDHPINYIINNPYSGLDGWQGWQYPLQRLLGKGNGYFIIKRSRGTVVDLVPAISGGNRWDDNGRGVIYSLSEFTQQLTGQVIYREYRARDVVALHWYGYDGLHSPSPIRHAMGQALMNGVGEYLGTRLDRATAAGPIFRYLAGDTATVTAAQVTRALKILRDEETGFYAAAKKNKIPVLPPGIESALLEAFSPVDIQLLDLMRWGVEDICGVYGVSPARLGHLPGGGAGIRTQSFRDQMSDLEQMAVRPVAGMVDSSLTRGLFTVKERMDGWKIVTDTSNVGVGTLYDRAELADKLVMRAGVYTPNEARTDLFGKPPVEDGDELRDPKGAPVQENSENESDMIDNPENEPGDVDE